MKHEKMLSIAVAVCMLLQMTSAYSDFGYVPSDALFLARAERSAEIACNNAVVDNLAKSARDTCSQIGTVDKYITNVKSRQQLSVPSFADQHGFKAILNQYNGDLKTAQDNCQPWREGINVVGSLKDVVVAAQGFEPKFNQELQENQVRIKNLLENHEDIAAVEAKISALEKDILEAKEAVKLTNVSAVVTHLEAVIKSKEEEINSTMKEHEVAQVRREVAELVKYLGFVKSGAAEVEGKAETARTKISNFKDNIVRDAGAFKRHRTNAQKGVSKLQQEKQNNNNELNSNKESIRSLTASITQENNQIASLNTQIANAQREMRESEARLNSSIRRVKKKKKWGRWIRWVPVLGKVYKDAKRKEDRLQNEKRNVINANTKQVQALQAHIASRNQDITRHQARIASLGAKSRELEQELLHFGELDGNLQSVENEANLILPFIASAVSAVSKMKDSFDTLKLSLSDAIQRANEAKTEAELNNMKYFIYNEIDQLKCEWDNASTKIGSVAQCS